jgi:fibronectin type 3 domain-containing protein
MLSKLLGVVRRVGGALIVLALAVSARGQSSVTLAWDASPGSSIAGYRLYEGVASLTYTNVLDVGNATTVTVSNLVSGVTYFFAVTAYDTNRLESDYSGEVSYTVPLPANNAPLISLTAPANRAVFTAPATINLAAEVTSNGHTISQVEFYNGATLLGTVAAAPYTFSWNNVDAGTYDLSAKAVDDSGGTVGSATANVAVAAAKPVSGLTFTADSGTICAPFVATHGPVVQPVDTGVTNGGLAVYAFNIVNEGDYLVSALVNAPSETNNSFYVNIDAEPTDPVMIWDIPISTNFTSRTVSWRGNGTEDPASAQYSPKAFTLSAGMHQLIIRGREANTALGTISIQAAPATLQVVLGLAVSTDEQNSVTLAWDASSDISIAGYRLYEGVASQTYSNVIDVGNATTAMVPNLVGGVSYFFAVTAYDADGAESAFSGEINYTVPLPMIMPPTIALSAQGQSSVTLTWDPSPDSAVAGYRLYEGLASQTYTNVIDVGNATAVTASGLVGSATYFYAVTAYDTDGAESAFSGEISYTVPLPANPPPAITLTALGGSVLLSGAGQPGQTYHVLASQDLNIWTVIGTMTTDDIGSFAFTDPAGTSSPIRMYRLQNIAVTPPTLQIQAAAGDPGSVTLTWDPSADSAVAGYRLYEGVASQTYTNVIDVGNATAVTASGLVGSATYFYALTAYDSDGAESAFSGAISYTVPLPTNPPPTITLTALGGSVLLSGAGQPGQTYNVLASQDLNIWTVIGTVTTDASGSFTFTDPAGTSSPIRMYRLSVQ